MKFKGQTVTNDNKEIVVIPRDGYNIVFIAKPVISMEPFNQLCIEPQPPLIQYPESSGRAPENDYTDPNYQKRLSDHAVARYYWMFLVSLSDSPDIVWDTVDMLKPETYANVEQELRDSEFLPAEINQIRQAVSIVNALDDRKMDEARKAFLASQQVQSKL
jgi:hypothetical protein